MRKICFLILAFLVFGLKMSGQSLSFKTYMNPVIPGDHPDCTVSKIGNDFYTTGSSFNLTPTIYHSTDLVHWEAIAQPVSATWEKFGDAPGGGCWGGHFVYHGGKYWDFFSRTDDKTGSREMYFVNSLKPEGPYIEPVHMNNPTVLSYTLGYDNSIFIDDNDKWYLIIKNGQPNGAIVELGDDGQPAGAVYDLKWLNPSPALPYSWAEGPVMWKYNGYYYYSFARDLAGGQKVMRSKTLTADESAWEMMGDFFNLSDPLLSTSKFTSPNHASNAVMISDSTSWVIHPLYAKGEWQGQGRQGLLNQVRYDKNGKPTADYPVNKYFTAPKLPSSGIPWMVPKSDFFSSDKFNAEWSKLGFTEDNKFSLTDRPGWLRLSPKSSKLNTLTKNDGEHNYSIITKVEFDAKVAADQAGLVILRGDEKMYVKLCITKNDLGHKVISFSFNDKKYEAENTIGNVAWLKILRVNHILTGYYSNDGINWKQTEGKFDVSDIDKYYDFSSFTGTRQGLFVQNSPAYFDCYIYRDAYSPILAECPVNQFGTTATTLKDGIYLLDSIHNNDWALYAGVEFGTGEYAKAADSVQIIASSVNGGNVEVWLDSIDTGTKIGTCTITSTGSLNTFSTFSAKVNQIAGRHDVYLKFTGTSTGKLFQLKWIKFIAKNAPHYVKSSTSSDSTILVNLSKSIAEPVNTTGFVVKLNGTENSIKNFIFNSNNPTNLTLIVSNKFVNTDTINISYSGDNIKTADGLGLVSFKDTIVENLLNGSSPRLLQAYTSFNGDTVIVQFNKKMLLPLASDFKITTDLADNITNAVVLKTGDSSKFIFTLKQKIYYENSVSITYSGSSAKSSDNGTLAGFSALPVINFAAGYPPVIKSSVLRKNGNLYKIIVLKLDKPVKDVEDQKQFFTVTINDQSTTIFSAIAYYDSIRFSINTAVKYGDVVKVSYSGSNIIGLRNGLLATFTNYTVSNNVPVEIAALDYKQNVRVYPNPVKDVLNISSEFEINKLSVFDISGKLLFNEKINNIKNFSIPVNLNTGTYILKTESRYNSSLVKFIVK